MENKKIKAAILILVAVILFVLMYSFITHKLFWKISKENEIKNDKSTAVNLPSLDSQDFSVYSKAMTDLNIKLCEKITNGDMKKACQDNIKSSPANTEEKNIADTYVLIFNSNNIERYEKQAIAYPDNTNCLLHLALSYSDKSIKNREFEKDLAGREYFNKAIATMDKADKLMSDKTQLYRVKAIVYLSNFEYDEAKTNIDEAIKLSPDKAYLYLTLAQILYQQKENNLALEESQKGLDLIKNNSNISEDEKSNLEVELYSVMVGAYHQLKDAASEEKYKKIIWDLMTIIKK